jgi:hypothetical protein
MDVRSETPIGTILELYNTYGKKATTIPVTGREDP